MVSKLSMEPLNVCLTGAAGQISYALLPHLLNGSVFGQQRINLRLLDLPSTLECLQGVVMEIEDCGYDLLNSVLITDSLEVAFTDCEVAILVGAMPRKQGMERKDLLQANARIFKEQGEALDQWAKKSVKVLVVGNPANTNAFIASHYAPSIPKESFSALTKLDETRARGMLARKLKVPVSGVNGVIIWGNHSNTQFPDICHVKVQPNAEAGCVNVMQEVGEDWYKNTFIPAIQTRGASVIATRKLSSALSAAKAIADHLTLWLNGTPPGIFTSMAVQIPPGDGVKSHFYGLPHGLFFSLPVYCREGEWHLVDALSIDDFAKGMLEATAKELIMERNEALKYLN